MRSQPCHFHSFPVWASKCTIQLRLLEILCNAVDSNAFSDGIKGVFHTLTFCLLSCVHHTPCDTVIKSWAWGVYQVTLHLWILLLQQLGMSISEQALIYSHVAQQTRVHVNCPQRRNGPYLIWGCYLQITGNSSNSSTSSSSCNKCIHFPTRLSPYLWGSPFIMCPEVRQILKLISKEPPLALATAFIFSSCLPQMSSWSTMSETSI